MESLKNISRIQLINLIFQSKDFQKYLVWYLYSGNLNKAKYRQRIGEVIEGIERFRKCKEFVFRRSTLEKAIVTQVLQVITSPDSMFSMIIKYQRVTQKISKESLLKYLQSIVFKNFYDESGYHSLNINNSVTFWRIVCCDYLNTKEKFPFFCLLDSLACEIRYCDSITDLTFVQKFQVATACNAGFVINHLWSTASEDDKQMLLNECKETITMQLASVLGVGHILQWFLERGVSVNYRQPDGHDTILHIAAQAGNVEAIDVLLSKCVKINVSNSSRETPVHAAATGGCQDALALLWNNNAELEPRCNDGNTPLHNAVDKEHICVVNFLLENRANVNARNNRKTTPLHIAAIRGNLYLIDLLIEKGADKEAVDYLNETPLQKACFRDLSSVQEVLLKKWGVGLHSQKFSNCTTELHVAATRGYFKSALVLLENNADANATDTKRRAPLHYAARGGFHAIAKLLMANNANVFAEDHNQRTAMHEACCNGHQAIVELLISKEENRTKLVNFRDQKGRTPLHYACRHGHYCVVEYLLSYKEILYSPDGRGRTVLHEAAWNGHREIVDIILNRHPLKADIINVVDYNGATAMQMASNFGHRHIANLLQSHGATVSAKVKTKSDIRDKRPVLREIMQNLDINGKNEFGETQLHAAVRMRNVALVKSILEHKGLQVNLRDSNQATALHLAIKCNIPEIVAMLITCKNVDLNAKNELHNSPLHCAVLEGNVEILGQLFHIDVFRKVKVNPRNKLNETPLHVAAKSGSIEILLMLLRRKVDFCAKTSDDKTALQIAVEKGNLRFVQCLIENKDDVDVRTKNGETILHLAIKNRRESLTEWILEKYADYVNFQNFKGDSALHFAIMSKNLTILKAVLQTDGVMINLRNNKQETPLLLLAAKWTNVSEEIIKLFLENPTIDVNVKLPNGRNALQSFAGKLNRNGIFLPVKETTQCVSEGSRKYDIIKDKLIVSDLANEQDQDGNSVLHLAALIGNQELLKHLIGCHSIDVNLQNNAGETALHLACREGHFDFVELILNFEKVCIDHEIKEYPWTPLALALNSKHWNIVRILLVRGAKVNFEVDSCGSSPLHFLTVHDKTDLVKLLLKRCELPKHDPKWLNISAADGSGYTALDYANFHQYGAIRDLLTAKTDEN